MNLTLLKFFPPPKFLSLPSIGLDISDRSIKFSELAPWPEFCKLVRTGELDLPVGLIENGSIKDEDKLSKMLADWRTKNNLKNVVMSLPEEHAFLVQISLPDASERELLEAIELQLNEYIPIPVEEAVFDYEIIKKIDKPGLKAVEVAVSAFPKDEALKYFNVFKKAGFHPTAFEVESQALVRALVKKGESGSVMIVDIGRTRTGVTVASDGVATFTSTIKIGGDQMTLAVKRNGGMSMDGAEKEKISGGLLMSSENAVVFSAILPILSSLKDELNTLMTFWKNKNIENGYHHKPVERVIICGGGAMLPGLDHYLSGQLKIPIEIGNPWVNEFDSVSKNIPELDFSEALRFSTAIGLALRGYNHYHD